MSRLHCRLLLVLLLMSGCASRSHEPPRPATAAGSPAVAVEGGGPPPAEAPAGPQAPTDPAPAAAVPQREGNKVLFLRLSLRTRRLEQDLLRVDPDGLIRHLEAAAQILRELRQRPLTPDEALRADRMEQYLQRLVEQYALLQMRESASR